MPLPVLAMMLCTFCIGTAESVIAGILPGIAQDVGVSLTAVGLLITVYAAAVVLVGPLVTAATATLRRATLLPAMMGVFVMGNTLGASAPGFGWLLVGRVVSAVVHSTLIAAFVAAARDTAPPDRRAAYGAKVTLGIGLSSVAGVPAGTLIGNAFGWRATFWALAAVSLAATALLTRFPAPESPRGTAKPAGLRRTAAPDTGPGRRRFVLPGPMLLVAAVITLGTAGVFALYTYASPYLTQSAGFGSGSVTVLLLLYGLGGIVGNTAGGRAADRFPSAAVPATLGAAAAGLLLLALPPGNRWAVAGVFCLLGTAYFATIPALNNAIVSAAGPSSSTMALTVNNSAFCVGIALGSWLGGLLLARGNTLPTVAAAGAASTAAALLLALLHTRLRKAPPGPALPATGASHDTGTGTGTTVAGSGVPR
ncbi:MFS transporter [Streptomyces variabilis]|uniref:MFS transporter n=1 Tax=Streptomyces variabilis TaxID=67372 RepID=A0ABQ2U073_9ACTN|nr:MFS transporter [Streptomyces variabilis]GGP74932.1 MFS transporter [Streptomyces griseoincarnatus]GGT59495.1 MFS transporter [Streptomyces variabilis]